MKFHGGVHIRGWALHLPPDVCTAEQAVAEGVAEPDVREVHGFESVGVSKLSAPEMAVDAGLTALEKGGVAARSVRLVVHGHVGHQGQDFWSPAHYVARHCGAEEAEAVVVQQLCNGSVAGLSAAACRMLADPSVGRALVTTADRFPAPAINRWRSDTTTVLGDGATALLLDGEAGELELLSLCTASVPALEEMHRCGRPFTDVPFEAGDPMSTHKAKSRWLQREGMAEFARISLASMRRVLRQAIVEAGATPDDPRLRIVTLPRLSQKLLADAYTPVLVELPQCRFVPYGSRTGHLGCGDLAANVAELLTDDHLEPGGIAVMLSAGAGFSWSCVCVRRNPPR
ncbi:ketoacyl-ACP synthase III family protein [Streptomyces monticola]|uniref:Ketoacyl-ACP synthase III family protein n=1 Tax=Streptomyces monticola TaxID=2666263 RepID=A0ABW2JPM1_9ACTN